jgi:hypothetical protein
MDMSTTVAPKSNQLNADDLITGPRTITITKVSGSGNGEQPVAVSFDGDGGKPFYPCKSMRRVMIAAWGVDASQYVGRAMTVYRDASVQYGGMAVGGIRISHMSHIEREMVMALTVTKAKRAPYTVKPLVMEKAAPLEVWPHLRGGSLALVQAASGPDWLDACRTTIDQAPHAKALEGWAKAMEVHFKALEPRDASLVQEVRNLVVDRLDALSSGEEAA